MIFISATFVGGDAPLVDDREVGVQPLGKRACPFHTAGVGRHDRERFAVLHLLADVGEQQRALHRRCRRGC
jgi:hypothetical protein